MPIAVRIAGVVPCDPEPESVIRTEPVFVDQHVGGLEVAVQDAVRVGGGEAAAQLVADVDDLLRRQPAGAAQQRRQVLALDELHRIEDPVLGLADVEDAADRRVGDLPREPHFVEDPLARLGGWPGRSAFSATGVCSTRSSACQTSPQLAPAEPLDHPVAAGEHVARTKRARAPAPTPNGRHRPVASRVVIGLRGSVERFSGSVCRLRAANLAGTLRPSELLRGCGRVCRVSTRQGDRIGRSHRRRTAHHMTQTSRSMTTTMLCAADVDRPASSAARRPATRCS